MGDNLFYLFWFALPSLISPTFQFYIIHGN